MVIGIIAEGADDQIIIRQILRAFGIDKNDVRFIKPSLQNDETDANNPDNPTIGTFQGVKLACEGNKKDDITRRPYFERFFDVLDGDFMVVHLDTAEIDRQDFPFQRPTKDDLPAYCAELRARVIDLINGWLEGNYSDKMLYAITIEEMEAWLLTLKADAETAKSADAKKKWREQVFPKFYKGKDTESIAKEFSKKKQLQKYAQHNQSLRDFVESIEEKTL